MSDKTVVNPDTVQPTQQAAHTTVNNDIIDFTVLNPNVLSSGSSIVAGTVLCDKYEVICPLDVSTGEADLYVCRYRNHGYVAKVYRRKAAIKDDVVDIIKNIDSRYIAKLHDVGAYNDYPFEILPYYKYGSLQGKTFSIDEIREQIIPSLNEGLGILHSNGIIHKDLKPSNIMLCDDGKNIAIIDFGISSIRDANNTVILTQTGMTPEYSAPETFRNLFLSESDYYSFGITVYELFSGSTPYKNMDKDTIEKYVAVQRIPFPDNMPKDLKDFISAVTYYDITNRKNKQNPNRRWTYNEVKLWLNGESQPIPGENSSFTLLPDIQTIPPYKFLKKNYFNIPDLVMAMAANWEEGKKQLFRGLMSSFFKSCDPEAAGYCIDAEEEASLIKSKNRDEEDLVFWKLLLRLFPENRAFIWKNSIYKDLPTLGNQILSQISYPEDNSSIMHFIDILRNRLLSSYLHMTKQESGALYSAVVKVEASILETSTTDRDIKLSLILIGYLLSGNILLQLDGIEFRDIVEFTKHIKRVLNEDYERFGKLCGSLIDAQNNLDICFEAWLLAIGKQHEIIEWKKMIVS